MAKLRTNGVSRTLLQDISSYLTFAPAAFANFRRKPTTHLNARIAALAVDIRAEGRGIRPLIPLPASRTQLAENLKRFLGERSFESVMVFESTDDRWQAAVQTFLTGHAKYATSGGVIQSTIELAQQRRCAASVQLDSQHALAVAEICEGGLLVFSLQRGPAALCTTSLSCAIEAWQLTERVREDQLRLDHTTKLIAQSQNEKTWLRSFATSIGAINRANAANTIAQGIFEPLRRLLMAESLFLIVEPSESERSGLQSCKFGPSTIDFEQIQSAAAELRDPSRTLIVRRQPIEGVSSLLGVKIAIADDVLGYLVAINRQAQTSDAGEEPSFADAIGLIEEAATLFATQSQNIHLVLESHQLVLGALHAMSSAIDARDPYTQGHSERVAKLAYEIAKILGISESACQEIYLAGLLHDLGKIGVPDHILHKAGALTDEEFAVIKQHPEIGHRIIERLGKLHFVLPGVLHHHERWDGKGYPHGLKQESIPLMARILAVADSFDAMTSSRPYRGAMPIERAATVIRDGAGRQWDAAIVDCFEIWLNRTLPALPIGIPLEAEDLLSNSAPFESISQVVIALNL